MQRLNSWRVCLRLNAASSGQNSSPNASDVMHAVRCAPSVIAKSVSWIKMVRHGRRNRQRHQLTGSITSEERCTLPADVQAVENVNESVPLTSRFRRCIRSFTRIQPRCLDECLAPTQMRRRSSAVSRRMTRIHARSDGIWGCEPSCFGSLLPKRSGQTFCVLSFGSKLPKQRDMALHKIKAPLLPPLGKGRF